MKFITTLALVALTVAGCNTALEGRMAPALQGAAWVRLDGSASAVDVSDKWAVIAFFSPT